MLTSVFRKIPVKKSSFKIKKYRIKYLFDKEDEGITVRDIIYFTEIIFRDSCFDLLVSRQ